MTLDKLLLRVLQEPTPDDLWMMHPFLLALESPEADAARALAGHFYAYLSEVKHKLTSKQYSSLAAMLAAGSVGVLAVQDVVEEWMRDHRRVMGDLLAGSLSAVLETISTLQHVKAWDTDFTAAHQDAIWHIYAELWRISAAAQPDLPTNQRQALIDNLLAAARSGEVNSAAQMVLIIRLFQALLVMRLAPLLPAPAPEGQAL